MQNGVGFLIWVQRDGDRMDAVATTPASIQVYWTTRPTVSGVFTTGGGFHFPVSASDFGA